MLQAILLDDIEQHRTATLNIIKEVLPDTLCETICFKSISEMMFCDKLCPDIAILDIDLKETNNGIDVAQFIAKKHPFCQIIFLTSYIDYVSDVYEVSHLYLVLKRDINENLQKALLKAVQELKRLKEQVLIVKDIELKTHKLNPCDIIFIEHLERHTYIHTAHEKIKTLKKISDFSSMLDNKMFSRCHQSFIVNLEYVKSIQRTEITLNSGDKISVSRKYYTSAQESFAEHISGLIAGRFN